MLLPPEHSLLLSSEPSSKHAYSRSVLQELATNTIPSTSDDPGKGRPTTPVDRKPTTEAQEAMDHGTDLLITPPPSSPYIDLRIPLQHSGSVHIMATSKAKAYTQAMATPPPSSSPCHQSHHARTPSVVSSVAAVPDSLVVESGHPVVIGRMAKPLDTSKTGPHLTQPGTVLFYTLPLKELEVSRLHIIVERVPGGVRLKAIGKNGLRIGNHFVGEGQEMILPEQKGLVSLDLWVKTIELQCALPRDPSPAPTAAPATPAAPAPIVLKAEEPETKDFKPPPTASSAIFSEATIPLTPTADRHQTTSLPPSSPASSPLSSLSSDEDEDDDEMPSPPRGVKRKAGSVSLPPSSPVKRVARSIVSDSDSDEDMDADGDEPEAEEQDAKKKDEEEDEEDDDDDESEHEAKEEEDDEDLLGEAHLDEGESERGSPTPSPVSQKPRSSSLKSNGKRPSSTSTARSPSVKRQRTAQEEAALRTAVLPHLVTALALSVTTTTPLSNLLPEVLEQSALASYDHEDITQVCRSLLEDGVKGMFGKVVRRGKDASGRPLENVYFYNADKDPDRERGRNLGGLGGRRVRGTQLKDKQYYWRPVGRKRT